LSTGFRPSGSLTEKLTASKVRGRPVDGAKRTAIVDAASRAFFDVGYAAASIEQIAEDAGVSKVTIYNHFGDKRALFAAAVELECEKLRGHFSIDAISSDRTIGERLTRIGEAMSAFLSRPEVVQFERRIAAETEHEPAIGRAFLESGPWRMKAAFSSFLMHSAAKGELRIEDAELAADQFASMCKGMGGLERRFGEQVDPAQNSKRIRSAVEVFLRAYASDQARQTQE